MADVDSSAATAGNPPNFKLFRKLILTEDPHQVAPNSPPSDQPKSLPEQESAASSEAATPLPCPRCKSREMELCYFNNYNLNQPRHFCRTCHQYWTAGGALRNAPSVPAGGGGAMRRPRPLGVDPPARRRRLWRLGGGCCGRICRQRVGHVG